MILLSKELISMESNIKDLNPTELLVLCKRLLMLGQLGCHLEGRDGHIWIESQIMEDGTNDSALDKILRRNHVSLNDKIYGGILEALATINWALLRAGERTLEEKFDDYHPDTLFLGKHGVDESRVDIRENCGGLY
jgi:hypothetical protein